MGIPPIRQDNPCRSRPPGRRFGGRRRDAMPDPATTRRSARSRRRVPQAPRQSGSLFRRSVPSALPAPAPGGVPTMDGHPRFVRPSAPIAPASVGLLAPAASPLVSARLNRRQAVQGLGAGAAALVAGAHGLRLSAPSAAARASNVKLTNPCSRVLMPGDKGLHDFSLDFSLSGAPTVFFFAGDTPGWSSDVKGSLDGFVFGYAATLADSKQSTGSGGRAVQVCVHHGFPSSADADIAWISLTTALNSRAYDSSDARVQSLDLVEVIVIDGESILATVAGGQTNAIVLASRSGSDLVTVAI